MISAAFASTPFIAEMVRIIYATLLVHEKRNNDFGKF